MQEELRELWVESGRPGVAKLLAAARRQGLAVNRAGVESFIRRQETRQVFAPGPRSGGKVTANGLDDRWQAYVIDFAKNFGASKNKGFRNVLVVVDVFSRFAWAIPMKSKSQEDTANAFDDILEETGRRPSKVDTDGGHGVR